MNVYAQAVQHDDVKGNPKYYLKLQNENGTGHYVHIGKGTFEKVTKLQEEEPDSPKAKAKVNEVQKSK